MRRQPCARRVLRRARSPKTLPAVARRRLASRRLASHASRQHDISLSSHAQVEEEAGVRSALGADLGTFYDMDKATVTVIFAMTVEEVREHRAGVYYYSAAFSARAEGATSLLRSQDLEVWEDMSTRRREWWPIEEVLARGSMKGRDREVSARGGDTAARARVPYADTSHAGAPPPFSRHKGRRGIPTHASIARAREGAAARDVGRPAAYKRGQVGGCELAGVRDRRAGAATGGRPRRRRREPRRVHQLVQAQGGLMANIANSAGGVRDRCAEQREAGGRAGGSGEGGGVCGSRCVRGPHTHEWAGAVRRGCERSL